MTAASERTAYMTRELGLIFDDKNLHWIGQLQLSALACQVGDASAGSWRMIIW
jgi:hypothetical protein